MGTLFDLLTSKFEEEIGRLKEHVAAGKCEDFGGYSHVCGQIRGLKSALNTTSDLAMKMEKDDE
jgi:hypothetical protein